MKLSIQAGKTSESVNIFIRDSSSTTGAGLTGLVFNTASLSAYYSFSGANATATAITLATLAAVNSAYSSGGFKEIDATNMPGWYRFDIPNAALASAKGRSVALHLKGAANMAPTPIEIELTGWDNQDGVHGGMSALPNTACTTNASLLTSGTGTDQLSVSAGKVLLQATQTGVTIPTVTTVGTLTTYTGNTPQTGDAYARLGAPAGASVSADVAAVKTDTGNLVTRITSTLFSGITSLAQWLGLLAGKQVGNSTARTEIRATGAGAGTFDETTDSQEALRDTLVFPTNFSSLAINASGHVILQDASLVTAKLGTFVLAKTTNITGFNDIAATSIVTGGAIITSGGVANANAVKWAGANTFTDTATSTYPVVATKIIINPSNNNQTILASGQVNFDALDAISSIPSSIWSTDPTVYTTPDTMAGVINTVMAQTDKLTFDGSNNVAANTKKINSTAVQGTGISSDKWRG